MARTALFGFVAGIVATLAFHQGTIWLYHALGLPFPFAPWNLRPNAYGAPAVLALAFWAGVWGILLAWLLRAQQRLPGLLVGFILGAIMPSTWGWTVIAGMRGVPLFAGGNLSLILLVLFVNGVWGAATVLILQGMQRRFGH